MPWNEEHLDRPTRIFISATFFLLTLFVSFTSGNEVAFGYAIFLQLIPSRPPAWFQPVLDFIHPYLGPFLVEQPPAPVRRILRSLRIRN